MSVTIIGTEKLSIAESIGVKNGDILLSLNGKNINDMLDYRFYETEKKILMSILRGNETLEFNFSKSEYAPIGLIFSTYLMDKEKPCKNKCIFCFIDQLPKGMRKSLYFKDDDERLSFLFGNYITLTNLEDTDINRIIDMHISPINVSVHTMNPKLRCEMMGNRFAGEKLKYLKTLCDGGIKINCQLVLCPNINDSDELKFSLTELLNFGENLQSVSCVPVGITKHRENLFNLEPFTKNQALSTIDIIENLGEKSLEITGLRKFYPSDEFYIIAEKELPPYEFYEDFPQIENGVGMYRNLEEELLFALEDAPETIQDKEINIVCGTAIFELLNTLYDKIRNKWKNITLNLYPIKNKFFGETIDVSGLIVGQDIVDTLNSHKLKGTLLIPDVMLKADEDIFLDDMTLEELEEKIGLKVFKLPSSGQDLIDMIIS